MPKLIYFGLGGRGEAIRLLLTHAKAPFEDVRIGFPEFGAMQAEGKFRLDGVPVWIEDDGTEVD